LFETYRGVVYPAQLDHIGHMNVQYYVSKFDEATWHLFAKIGITPAYIREQKKGMAAVEQHIKYKSEVMAGDLLVIKSRFLEVREKVIRFEHIMYNAETNVEVASCELSGVHMDREIRKACPLPKEIFQKGKELSKQNRSI
jgi:acyl-CoA thioester hydrolase